MFHSDQQQKEHFSPGIIYVQLTKLLASDLLKACRAYSHVFSLGVWQQMKKTNVMSFRKTLVLLLRKLK